jgi:N-acetylmuramoyl-L-alanine amidase
MRGPKDAAVVFSMVALASTLLVAPGAGEAARKDRELYLALDREHQALKKTKITADNHHRWLALARRMEKFQRDLPKSAYADNALFSSAKIYDGLYRVSEDSGMLDRAIKNWLALLRRYPKSPWDAEAQFWVAASYEEGKGDIDRAKKHYRALIERYPEGIHAAKARDRLALIDAAETGRAKTERPPDGEQAGSLLTRIRHTSSQSYTRVIMELSSESSYETHFLQEDADRGLPPRIYVDLNETRLGLDSSQPIRVQDQLLRQVRVGQFAPNVVRVVLDLRSVSSHRAFLLPDPYRLVVDINAGANGTNLAGVEKPRALPPAPKAKPPPSGLRKIVLDPGHGGKDPGAIGIGGAAEKDIVLSLAKKLARRLRRELRVEVVLTREDDRFIPLEDRTAIANAEGADLFISLHVNASPSHETRGIETYYLDNTNDEASILLAARENGTARRNISDLQFILSDLTQNSKLEESITLAHRVHTSLVSHMGQRYGDVKDLGVKKALFYVLVGARMPSILAETSFITHKSEGRALTQKAYQEAIVEGLFSGIKKYHESLVVVKNL